MLKILRDNSSESIPHTEEELKEILVRAVKEICRQKLQTSLIILSTVMLLFQEMILAALLNNGFHERRCRSLIHAPPPQHQHIAKRNK
jgi:hypothetical protein